MRKSVLTLIGILVIASVLLTACGGGGGGGAPINRQKPPAEFASMTNPFEGKQDAVSAGKTIFDTNCAACHGDKADGTGPAGASLDPKPANLQKTAKETDPQYINWVIHVGGATAGLNAAMPAFKDVMSDDDIWQVVTYLEATYGK